METKNTKMNTNLQIFETEQSKCLISLFFSMIMQHQQHNHGHHQYSSSSSSSINKGLFAQRTPFQAFANKRIIVAVAVRPTLLNISKKILLQLQLLFSNNKQQQQKQKINNKKKKRRRVEYFKALEKLLSEQTLQQSNDKYLQS